MGELDRFDSGLWALNRSHQSSSIVSPERKARRPLVKAIEVLSPGRLSAKQNNHCSKESQDR
jgi:hypothetical protein